MTSNSNKPETGQKVSNSKLQKSKNEQADTRVVNEIMQAASHDRWEGWMILTWGSLTLLILLIVWAANFDIEEVTSGPARVIPSSREQVLQSLEGGILKDMLVQEGDTVEKGQILVRIDPARAEAAYLESAHRMLALRAQAARLRAESLGTEILFPEDVLKNSELTTRELESYRSRKQALEESIENFVASKKLINQELDIAKRLAAQELLSDTEVLKLRRQANDAELQITERRNRYHSEASAELTKVEAELSSLGETAAGRHDTLVRTELRSPVYGIINNIRINTIGGVIQPGAEIMEVTPLGDTLLVETKIKPADVAFLIPGQEAMVKLSAYDYSLYGGLKGNVVFISPGALKDEEARGKPGVDPTYYRVIVRTEGNTLTKAGSQKLKVLPGMTATVDIRTGQKSFLSYLLRPLLRVQEAFREK
ncbi:HlyD family type I secretion periplasmic adaptor subunit [Budvicia diplopodorum]|uniref:HlyD family type I secretion periplasmic adaptor subunit n=1 Tax=Budvicia diplopodorum TaxID=1119056 RepID=UPI001358360A|nr:HlyD family type I secretion periplasmic adaptor subunit [Budvicia diplopodorum]